MRKLFKFIFVFIFIILFSGCMKNYKKLSYTEYNEYFNNKNGYIILDHSSDYGVDIIRNLEAGNGKIQVIYMEFSDEKTAKKYIDLTYDNYKIKEKDNYTIIKSNKGKYFRLYRVENVIVYAQSEDKSNKKEIKSILKDLGF
mgnify:FL=1